PARRGRRRGRPRPVSHPALDSRRGVRFRAGQLPDGTGRSRRTGMKQDRLSIRGGRLVERLFELAKIGAIEGGGCCRLALTDEDRQGRDLVVSWMKSLGLAVTVDRIGNVVGVRAGRTAGPPVMVGSHVDTVRTGGRYDGNLGVL